MFPRWWRLGIRPQLTIIVILGAVLTTVATLFIADSAIRNYVLTQAQAQERDDANIALLVLHNNYGANVSIDTGQQLVADSPNSINGNTVNFNSPAAAGQYGKFVLNNDTDYVDSVKHLINADVSLYQCANDTNTFTPCLRVASTFVKAGSTNARDVSVSGHPVTLSKAAYQGMQLASGNPQIWLGNDTEQNIGYYADFTPVTNAQNQLVGVLVVEVPLNTIDSLINRTTVELILIGSIIMVASIIIALFFANAIINALQRAARQVSSASERIGSIATQQASGAAQQVWAINAINQALQNFSDTAKDISQRTDQLALMGNQVLQRRGEIPPSQIDSILAYMTRSVRDISGSSRQQAAQYERMTGAMQAVIEIAEQVSGNSQQSTESAERLDLVVRQLQQVVGVRLANRRMATNDFGIDSARELGRASARQNRMKGTVHSVRPDGRRMEDPAAAMVAAGGRMGFDQMPVGQMGGGIPNMGMPSPASRGLGANAMPAMPAMPGIRGRGMAGQMDPRMMGGMMGADAGQSNWQSGRLGGRPAASGMTGSYGARPGYGGPDGMGGMMGVEDWRLPPLPELDLPPGWEDMRSQGYNSMPPQDQMGNAPRSGPRPLLPPQRASGRGSNFGPDYHLDPNNGNGWGR